jgi:hypothetical protein
MGFTPPSSLQRGLSNPESDPAMERWVKHAATFAMAVASMAALAVQFTVCCHKGLLGERGLLGHLVFVPKNQSFTFTFHC